MKTRTLVSFLILSVFGLFLVWYLEPWASGDLQVEPPLQAADVEIGTGAVEADIAPGLMTELDGEEAEASLLEANSDRELAGHGARWIDVVLVVPEQTPRGEQAWVAALRSNGNYEAIYGTEGPFVELHAGQDPARIDAVLGAAVSGPTGAVRVALPPDAEDVWLAVGGSYLYSLELIHVDVTQVAGPVQLRPVLGAWISGRLLAPGEDSQTELGGIKIGLTRSLNSSLQLGAANSEAVNLKTTTDSTGVFEFRAIPVGKPKTLVTESVTLAASFSEDLAPSAGEHLELVLPMIFGGIVRGRVVSEEGVPVADADVHALGREFFGTPTARLRETKSAADGSFELAGISPELVWVRVRHDDYQDRLDTPFELIDGEVRQHGDVVLSQGLIIAGTLLFPKGGPAAGAEVSVQPDLSENISGSLVNQTDFVGAGNENTVDERGEFRITGLGPGPWVVTAQLIELDDGEEDGIAVGRWTAIQNTVRAPAKDIHLVLVPPVNISGTVVDGKGEPVKDFQIHAERAGSQWYMPPSEERTEEFESEDGLFRVANLRTGKWTISAESEGYARSEEATLELPSEEVIALVLLRPVRVAGEVLDPEGKPVAGAEVSKELEGTEVFEALQGRGDWPSTSSDAEGKYSLEGLLPGAGSVLAKMDGFAPSAAIAYELAEGEESVDVVLTLRRGGSITGEVYNADGTSAAGCLVIVQMPTFAERRITNAGPRGEFAEHGLTPGTWQVQAFPGVQSLQTANGEALDQAKLLAALKMTTVELADETTEHVILGEAPADPVRVTGRVTLDKEPVSGAMISFVPASGGMDLLKIGSLEDDGRYDLTLDEAGDYLVTIQVTVAAGRQNSIEFRRSIPSGGDFKLDFEMPLGRVSGQVRAPNGEPSEGARVTLNMDGGQVFGTVFGGQYNETVTDANGEYDILYLRPGRYAVAAGGSFMGGFLGDSVGLGREVTVVEIEENQWVRNLDFRLTEPGTIRGTVRDAAGTPIAGASLFFRDEHGRLLELFSFSQTNATGGFDYPGLAPGEYTVTARTAEFASSGDTPVRVRSGETSEVTVVVESGTILLVSLLDKSGADLPSRVSVLDAGGREMNGMLGLNEIMERYNTGLDRAVQRVGPLAPGKYVVRAITEDGRSTERKVRLSGKPERKVRLRLD